MLSGLVLLSGSTELESVEWGEFAHRPPNSILAAKATGRSYIDRCPLEALNFGKVF